MAENNQASGNGLMLLVSWVVVGVPLVWGVWTTLMKLPVLFK